MVQQQQQHQCMQCSTVELMPHEQMPCSRRCSPGLESVDPVGRGSVMIFLRRIKLLMILTHCKLLHRLSL